MTSSLRRLPVYLLLDCSESMAGEAIDSVTRGVQTLITEMRSNPLALETVYLSLITFSREAKQVLPLTELYHIQPPKLSVRPGTAMGAALRLLMDCLKRDVVRTTATTKGDYKPLIFILTDGQPTDDWQSAADALKAPGMPKVANVIAIGCGPDVEIETLYRITDTVLLMTDVSAEAFRKLFVWLSASVQTASLKIEGATGAPVSLPTLPADTVEIAERSAGGRKSRMPRQVFLHVRCSKTRQPYLMRYSLNQYGEYYDPVVSHPLEEFEPGDADTLPPINSSLLNGCPPCPYCRARGAGMCACGGLLCDYPNPDGSVTCPGCGSRLGRGGDGSFDVKRTQG
jgi:uncharacterized protein YegL